MKAFSTAQTFKRTARRLMAMSVMAVPMLAACSSVHTKTPEGEPVWLNENEFAAYVEQVFRHHNKVVDETLFVTADGLNAKEDPVSDAEMKMDHACQPLNETVSATAAGESPGFWPTLKLANAVPECEAATRHLEKLLLQNKD